MATVEPTLECPQEESPTTLGKTEEQLHRDIQHLIAAREASSCLIDAMAHDCRTPLTVIQEYCSLVRDGLAGPVTDQQREYLEIAMGRAADLGRLLNDFSDAAGLDSGTHRLRPTTVRLADIADRLESALQARAATGRVRIKFRVSRDLPDVYCDADMIGRAISNIACHAMRSSEGEGVVEIWAERAPDERHVVVVVASEPNFESDQAWQHGSSPSQSFSEDNSVAFAPTTFGIAAAQTIVRASLSELRMQRRADRGTAYFFRLPEADPETVMACYIRHRKASGGGLTAVALVLVSLDEEAGGPASDALDELLGGTIGGADLMFRLESFVWVLIVDATREEPEAAVKRIRAAWIDSYARHAKRPPEMLVEIKAIYHIPSQIDETPMSNDDQEFPVAPREPQKPCILLVDDDRSIVDALRLRLTLSGYEVLTAHDGMQGLVAATDHRPNLILLDVRMPVMDGLTMLARLHDNETTRRIPVVMVSASHDDRQRALELGAYFFLEKPYDPNVLKITIASILRSPEARKIQVTKQPIDTSEEVC